MNSINKYKISGWVDVKEGNKLILSSFLEGNSYVLFGDVSH